MVKCPNCGSTTSNQYVIYIHTRSQQEGFLYKNLIGDKKYPIFPTEEKAWEHINTQHLGWRWSGYCSVREYKGEFEND